MSNSVGVSVLECKTIILISCGHFKVWYRWWIEGEGDGEEKEVDKTTIYLSLELLFYLEWYTFDIIFYEYKVKKKNYLNLS